MNNDQSHKADAYQDWVDHIVVHVNECDADIITVEGHYKYYEYELKRCANFEEGNALKAKLDAFLANQPDGRARIADVVAAVPR